MKAVMALLILPMSLYAGESNAQQARKLFNSVYNMVFASKGCTLHYDVNIIGIYKTKGTISYKGKKNRYAEERYLSWNDGVTAYMVDRKKKTVNVYRADDDNKDGYLSKFKYDLNNFEYSWKEGKDGIQLILKPKTSHLVGIRQVIGVLDSKTHYPKYLRIKVAFFWTTVKISHFSTDELDDKVFVFPRQQFSSYRFTDHRKE